MNKNVVVFGASGSIGTFICDKLVEEGKNVIPVYRDFDIHSLPPSIHSAVWCQGININDTIGSIDYESYINVIDVNLNYIITTLDSLVKHKKLDKGSRCVIISSIWQEYARDNKLSYTVSKSAIGGLVRSCSIDLGSNGVYINALLPGPIDNPMTRNNLTPEQLSKLSGFVQLGDVWQLTKYLCFFNNSTNGQSILIDLGLSVRKTLF